MFNRVTSLFGPAHLYFDLVIQLWIAFILIYVLLLKDCLYIFLWTCHKFKRIVIRILQILCVNNSLVWTSFLKEVQKNFPEQISPRLSNKQQQGIESSIKTPMCQAQRNKSPAENKRRKQYKCQSCQMMSDILLQRKNLNRTSYSPLYEVLKHNVSTQTETKRERRDLNSPESLNNCLKSSHIKKQIALTCNFSSPRCSSFKFKNDSISRSLSPEFVKIDHSPMIQNDSRRTTTEEYANIPLESAANCSQLLESQINIGLVRDLGLQLSQDICIKNGSQTVTECQLLSPEFEKFAFFPLNQNDSRTATEANIPLESTANTSEQLESSFCHINFESIRNLGLQSSQDFCTEKNVGSQTVTERESVDTEYSQFPSPIHNSIISIFGKELDFESSLNNHLKSNIESKAHFSQQLESQISLESMRNLELQLSQDICIQNSVGTQTVTECEIVSPEFEKIVSSPINQNDSKTAANIPLESTAIASERLESSACQMNFESIRNSGLQSSQDFCITKNFGTQTVNERQSVNTEYSHFQSPIHSSFISVIGKEVDSEESLNNHLESSIVKKRIALKSNISFPSWSTFQLKNDSNSRSLIQEFDSSPMNQYDSRRLVTDEYIDIPLESPPHVSQLLESPLCHLNLESMRNLRLQFSQDVCIPRFSPEEKSLFKKGWNKLKLMQNVNKRFLELKNIKRKQDEVPTIPEQYIGGEASNISYHLNKEESNKFGCCSYLHFITQRLKSKFVKETDDATVTYKKF